MTYTYSVYGLTYELPLHCPFLSSCETHTASDVTVVYGSVSHELADAEASDDTWEMGFCWQAAPGRYLLKGGRKAGRFLVEEGQRVTLHRNEGAEDERLLFHLMHSVTAALFRQRGFLVLHASTVKTKNGAIVLSGKTRAGKSTTLAAMLQKGCGMVSDDITVLCLDANSRVSVVPGLAMMHLWEDAAQNIGMDVSSVSRHPLRPGKAALPAPAEPCSGLVPVTKLCIIEPFPGEKVTIQRPMGKDKLDALMDCVYGPLFPKEHENLFTVFSAVAGQTEILRIQRPERRWTLDDVVKAVFHG